MVPGYVNTSALSGTLRPVNLVHTYSGGSDGGAIISTDYTGDSAGSTGFYSFDDIDDCLSISAPAMSTTAIHTAGTAYVEGRKDMVYYAHLASLTANGLATERAALNIDSAYVAFFAGGLRIISSISGSEINISELGDIIGISGRVDADPQYGPWWSIAGDNRGKINNALGVVSNFGSAGKFNDLNLLANRQINVVLVENGKIKLSGNFTAQLKQTRLSYLSIRKLLITIKKDLKPTLKAFIEEPNDPLTWKAIFRAVKPYLDDLASEEKRALHSYRWEGDQNVSKADDVVINKKSDIDQGKYKAKLFTKEIVSLQDIEVNIILTPSSVEFEEVQQNS
jgi:phage tail sheath protein FI